MGPTVTLTLLTLEAIANWRALRDGYQIQNTKYTCNTGQARSRSVVRVAVNAVVGGGGGGVHGLPWSAGSRAGEVHVIWLDVSMFECLMGARVVVVGVAGRGGLRWWQGARVVVVRCVLLAETAVGRPKQK